jgi:hypothetical protein
VGSIPGKLLKKIVDCLLVAIKEDIMPIHQDILCPPMAAGLLKLQDRFKKK